MNFGIHANLMYLKSQTLNEGHRTLTKIVTLLSHNNIQPFFLFTLHHESKGKKMKENLMLVASC